jgi:hypothetical protein
MVVFLIVALWPGRSTFSVSPETTYVTEPLDADGCVDYPTALNERMGRGVTPDTNANVLIWQALGPKPEGSNMPVDYFRWLGMIEPPEEGTYFIDRTKYFRTVLKDRVQLPKGEPEDGEFFPADGDAPRREWDDRVTRATKWPWKAAEQPDIADWLKRNEEPLAIIVEASKRPHYYNPLVNKANDPRNARLLGSLLPSVQKCREVGAALACRAMGKVSDGDFNGAWNDLQACHRLARLLTRSGTLIETLVGIALDAIASNAELTFLSHSKHSSKQILAWLADLRRLPPMPPIADKLDLTERFMTLDTLQCIAIGGVRQLEILDGNTGMTPPSPVLEKLSSRSIDFDPAFRKANKMYDRLVAVARLPDRTARKKELGGIDTEIRTLKAELDAMSQIEKAAMGKTERGEMIGNTVIALLLPAVEKMQDAMDRAKQTEDNLHLAFALAAHRADTGRYPAQLNELTPKYLSKVPGDVFSGQSLIYRPTADGYLLYSVGQNEKDDDGRWFDDQPRGDDPRVRMPAQPPEAK